MYVVFNGGELVLGLIVGVDVINFVFVFVGVNVFED